MPKRKPDKREQKRIDKHNREEESRRARVILKIEDGASLRDAGSAVGRCHMFAKYWRDAAMERQVYGSKEGIRRVRYVLKKKWRDIIKMKRPGPPAGICPKRDKHRDAVIAAKVKHPQYGCVKIAIMEELEVSAPTICEILKAEGLIRPVKGGKLEGKRFRAGKPNEMWQIDYVDVGHGYCMLSVMDDHSGKILSRNIRRTMTTDDVLEIMNECFRAYGRPKRILSDHGVQWYATRGGDTRFDIMCSKERIKHIMGRMNHPQTQGKVERWHRSLKFESGIKNAETFDAKIGILDGYVEFYNTVRPHWGIGLKTPDSVYFAATPV
jgi:transposase InsO family protein